jgi:hypothetical protein
MSNRMVDNDNEILGYIQQVQECLNRIEEGQWLEVLGVELMPRLAWIVAEEEVEEK